MAAAPMAEQRGDISADRDSRRWRRAWEAASGEHGEDGGPRQAAAPAQARVVLAGAAAHGFGGRDLHGFAGRGEGAEEGDERAGEDAGPALRQR